MNDPRPELDDLPVTDNDEETVDDQAQDDGAEPGPDPDRGDVELDDDPENAPDAPDPENAEG